MASIFPAKQLPAALTLALTCFYAGKSNSTELEVAHWWTSGGESAAVQAFADAFNAGGDTWIDSAVAGGGGVARGVIISRIIGGDPMAAMQFNHGRQVEELVEAGLMLDLTELAEKEGWHDFIRPSKLLESCTLNGRIYCAPINIHSWQWMWTSLKAYEAAAVAPPKDWHEFVASAPQLREKGIIPLAVGTQPWQISGIFQVLMVGLGGADLWQAVSIDRDLEVIGGPRVAEIWQAYATARTLADPNNTENNWSDATTQLINGEAAAQIIGDWAQGEFSVAGFVPGKEYDCLPGLGLKTVLDTAGDAFYFPKLDDPEKTAAQFRLASAMLSKTAQLKFNLAKGSLPVRADIDLSDANDCMIKGLNILNDGNNVLPSASQLISNDTEGELQDLMVEFWTDHSVTPEQAQETYLRIMSEAQ